MYYEDYDRLDEVARDLYRKGMAAFDGNAPSYHIELRDCPTIVWDFHSLSLNIQMMFACMLADSAHPLRLCRQCAKAFVASRPSAVFCGSECKNRYNVYKAKGKSGSMKGGMVMASVTKGNRCLCGAEAAYIDPLCMWDSENPFYCEASVASP